MTRIEKDARAEKDYSENSNGDRITGTTLMEQQASSNATEEPPNASPSSVPSYVFGLIDWFRPKKPILNWYK